MHRFCDTMLSVSSDSQRIKIRSYNIICSLRYCLSQIKAIKKLNPYPISAFCAKLQP